MKAAVVIQLIISVLITHCACAAANSRLDELSEMIDAGWWTDAGRELNEIVEENGDLPRAHYLLATIYLRELDMGRRTHWDEAEDHAKKAVELDGSDVENLMILGHIMGIKARDGSKLSAMGRAKTAKGSYEKAVELQPDNLQARKWLINFHMNAPGFAGGDKEEARRQAEAVAKIDPVEGHYSHADIYEFLDKDLAKAEEELKAALAAQPDESKTYYMYANFLSRNGRYEDAVKQMKALAAVEPASSGPWFGIGTYAERAERWDEAAGQYEKLAAVDSTRRDAMMRLGFLGQKQEKWDEALAGFQAAWSEDPEYYYALYQVGKTNLLGEIDLAAAEAAFKEYISARTREDGPSKADAYWRLAMVYDAMGERKQAKAACKQATKLDSKHEQAKKLYKKLKRR